MRIPTGVCNRTFRALARSGEPSYKVIQSKVLYKVRTKAKKGGGEQSIWIDQFTKCQRGDPVVFGTMKQKYRIVEYDFDKFRMSKKKLQQVYV